MSDFLEEVLSAPPPSHRRAPALGLSTTRRYALMLTVMAGMTAVPTWLVLKAGSDSLSSSAPLQVSPLLAAPAGQALQDPPRVRDEPVPTKQTPKIIAPEPAPPGTTEPLVEEHTAVVKTKKRPVHKPSRTPRTPTATVTPSTGPSPAASPGSPSPSGTGLPGTPSASPGAASAEPPSRDVVDVSQLRAALEAELRAELSQVEQEIRDAVRKELSGLVRTSPGSGGPAR